MIEKLDHVDPERGAWVIADLTWRADEATAAASRYSGLARSLREELRRTPMARYETAITVADGVPSEAFRYATEEAAYRLRSVMKVPDTWPLYGAMSPPGVSLRYDSHDVLDRLPAMPDGDGAPFFGVDGVTWRQERLSAPMGGVGLIVYALVPTSPGNHNPLNLSRAEFSAAAERDALAAAYYELRRYVFTSPESRFVDFAALGGLPASLRPIAELIERHLPAEQRGRR